ncbi:DNA-binding response regulator [Clostridium thermosuccinogenes]|uniref:Stage 0 sporulation protein A homolog n=1 Tax=Clostridium thermosuccinogenes TaxID=84032 RepID=A0A2K2FNN8_9CLOT|nr:response regulator transcription factor [Pseudoclostridium thermosuccinogenes]AUS97409.1 DNA-binding response regulator [Pseudoclostridium thermosuccinogenes]PNT98240.1 DNA-binding response regulator [Pseudoclostridium thermosuccinogenes]PNU00390.1 DNA-binding response regulator [Pseudoclostridium thermosuccinogenes]
MKRDILVVDDEKNIISVVKSYLEKSGYTVYTAFDGKQALQKFDEIIPSLIILDLMLPDIPGEEVCTIIRKKSAVPIIMLTAKVKEEDILNGLHIGADDYVTKPFSPRQLVARVSALLRRSTEDSIPLDNRVSFNNDDLVVDTIKYEVKKDGELVKLTPNEYKLLMTLIKYSNKTLTREELVKDAFKDSYSGYSRVVDTHIKNLRHKIETDPKLPEYILTVHGVGYRFGFEQ